VLLFYLLGTSAAHADLSLADGQSGLKNARNAYAFGDYPAVIASLTPIIEPDILLPNAEDQAAAYEMLGLAHFFLEELAQSRLFFERLIRLRPGHVLDPVRIPPPAITQFDLIKSELEPELERTQAALRAQQAAEAERRRRANLVRIERDVRVNSRLVASLPFGAGQFQNGDQLLGGLLLGSQLLTAVASAACYIGVERLRGVDGKFRPDDAERAQSLQTVQIATGTTALALMLAGAAHALITFEPVRVLDERSFSRPRKSGSTSIYPGGIEFHF
jgi:tetratricopeptide (TPR) repeat protein